MGVTAAITAAIGALQTAVTAARPLEQAPGSTLFGLREQIGTLVRYVDSAIAASKGTLDGPEPDGTPQAILASFVALAGSAADQSALVDLRGFVGRAAVNFDQVTS